jgi:3-phenylpropionate/cinnamic acid dioxygenase small subunit
VARGTVREDHDEIVDVLIRYATAIDRRDWSLFRSCFTAYCTSDYGFGTWSDLDGLTNFMAEFHAPLGLTMHRITNPVTDVDGDTASARSYLHALLTFAAPDAYYEALGIYDDRLVHTDEGWKISHRTYTAVRHRGPDDPSG